MKTKNLLLFIFLFAFQFCFAQISPELTPIISKLRTQLGGDLAKDNIHGSISVAIIKNDHMLWAGAFGFANETDDRAADSTTIYRIGSITKTFTATLLMQLVEEGKIKLDDPVENYLPEIKSIKGYDNSDKITFRQLASHTAGLNREPDVRGGDIGSLDQWQTQLLAFIPYCSTYAKPGQRFLYSNIGFALLGLAMERATGVPYIQMIQQRILTPLHMDDTFFALPDDKRGRLAEGLENSSSGKINTKLPLREITGRGYRVPNGGIFSTPVDLAKFAMSMMGKPALLTEKSRNEMREVPIGGKNYGLGLMLTDNWRSDKIGHNGSVPGYTSQLEIDLKTGYAVILMRNYNIGVTNMEEVALDLLSELKKVK